jgi:hypothetical protein
MSKFLALALAAMLATGAATSAKAQIPDVLSGTTLTAGQITALVAATAVFGIALTADDGDSVTTTTTNN